MRLVSLLLVSVSLACNSAVPGPEQPEPEPPEPMSSPERRVFVVSTPEGAPQLVRVEATGVATPVGPALSEATPAVARVGRLLHSRDGQRALVQDNTTGKTHVLRDGRWDDLCADIGAQGCYATAASADLSTFILNRNYDDPSGTDAVILSYEGDVRAPSDGRIALHSTSGWTAFTDGDLFVLTDDGQVRALDTMPGEVPRAALGQHLLTFSNDYENLWFRDPATGQRRAARCPDGSAARDIMAGKRYQRCADDLLAIADGALEVTGNRLPGELPAALAIHVEPDSYTLVTHTDSAARMAEVAIVAADGAVIAREERRFDEVEGWTSEPVVHVLAWSATPAGAAAYVTFTLLGLAHDDVVLSDEHGILVWRQGQPVEWHAIDAEPSSDLAASSVWFPTDEERAYWVTRDRRLLGFDHAAGELSDYSSGLEFQPNIY